MSTAESLKETIKDLAKTTDDKMQRLKEAVKDVKEYRQKQMEEQARLG